MDRLIASEKKVGLPKRKSQWPTTPAKWIKLLGTSLTILVAVGGLLWGVYQFNAQQQSDSQKAVQQQQLTRQQEEVVQQEALNQQEATILQTYIDNIQDLLLNHHLLSSNPGDEIRQVAREQTLTTLRRLDAEHNRIVLRFLQDAHLIGVQDAVINLSNADLSNDDLSGTDLSGTNLSGTNLNSAHLSGAILNGAHLSSATLSGADLNGAVLNGATLSGAILKDANLNDADLSNTTLSNAILNGATLSGATLSNADLSGADLSGADLSYAGNLTQQQLDNVSSCTKATLLFTGLTCHPNRGGSTVTLTYWYTESPAETPVILQRIQQFQQQNPSIKINAVYKPFYQAQAAFINASQTGKAPDVLRSDVGWVTQFASQYYLLDIDPFVSQSDLLDYLNVPLSYDRYNGRLYGLPQVTDFLALLYNKAALAKVGITSPYALATMADFEAAAMKIKQSKAAPYGFETTGAAYYMLPFLWAFGGGMIDQHNNILVNNAGSVAGLTFLLKLQNGDRVMPPPGDFSNGLNNMVNDFMRGKTAMIFDGPWDVSYILKNGSAFTGNPSNLGIAGIPTGPTGQTGSPVGGQSYVISAGTAHPKEAYKFISFMSSTASQVTIAQANHTLPTRNSAYQDPRVSSDLFIQTFHAIQNTAVARPAIPQGGYLFDAFDPNIVAALEGAQSATEALNAVAGAWKQLLAGS